MLSERDKEKGIDIKAEQEGTGIIDHEAEKIFVMHKGAEITGTLVSASLKSWQG